MHALCACLNTFVQKLDIISEFVFVRSQGFWSIEEMKVMYPPQLCFSFGFPSYIHGKN